MCAVMETWVGGEGAPATFAGNVKCAATKCSSASGELGCSAWNCFRMSSGEPWGTASGNSLLSGNIPAVCTAMNRSLNNTCGGSVAGPEAADWADAIGSTASHSAQQKPW